MTTSRAHAAAAAALALLLLAAVTAAEVPQPGGGRKRSFGFRVQSRDGAAHTFRRSLLRNATIPLHGAVKDYGWVLGLLRSRCSCPPAAARPAGPGCVARSPLPFALPPWPGPPRRSYFYATLYLGTPAKKFAVIVDTGSTMTYVPCTTCGAGCGPHHQDAAFDPEVGAGPAGGRGWVALLAGRGGAAAQGATTAAAAARRISSLSDLSPAGLDHGAPHLLHLPQVHLRVAALRLLRATVHLHAQLRGAVEQQRHPAGGRAGAARRCAAWLRLLLPQGRRVVAGCPGQASTAMLALPPRCRRPDPASRASGPPRPRPAGQPGAPIIFGCETRETGEIYKQRADGLFGLGNSDASGAR